MGSLRSLFPKGTDLFSSGTFTVILGFEIATGGDVKFFLEGDDK